MIRVSKHLAALIALAYGLAVGGVESYIPHLPGWATFTIIAVGVVLSALGIPGAATSGSRPGSRAWTNQRLVSIMRDAAAALPGAAAPAPAEGAGKPSTAAAAPASPVESWPS